MKVVWSRQVLADLTDIATYFATNASPTIADAVGRRFADVIERVRPAPLSAPRVAQRSEVRVVTVVRYPLRIFYRVRGETIDIFHIRHTSQRPLAGLNDTERQYAWSQAAQGVATRPETFIPREGDELGKMSPHRPPAA